MFQFSTFFCSIFIVFQLNSDLRTQGTVNENEAKAPTICVVLLARNKEHTLPYFLTLFERLEYPKKRMSLFIRSDHNVDKTITILEEWLAHNQQEYHSCNVKLDKQSTKYPDDVNGTEWSEERYINIIRMKEEALSFARQMWADYIWFLDMDVFITNSDTLNVLVKEEKAIVAPMLNSLNIYSNFWGGMTQDYWYERAVDYRHLVYRWMKGCFFVPLVHSCVLVDLRRVDSDDLTFTRENVIGYDGPLDDIITFAISARNAGIDMHVCNSEVYGFIPPPLEDEELELDYKQLRSIKLEVLVEHPPLPVSQLLSKYVPPLPKKDKIGFDEIYMINLARRPERRERMYRSFDELGLDVKLFDAVDGKQLNESSLEKLGVKQLTNYTDVWGTTNMTFGEIGCTLSHYFIWQDIVSKGYKRTLVFEDDVRFKPNFREKVKHMIHQADELVVWDYIYLGRRKTYELDELWVEQSDALVHVHLSFGTHGYVISLQGARKLLDSQPLEHLLVVDIYIAIMSDTYPKTTKGLPLADDESKLKIDWLKRFPVRNLNVFSISPLLIYQTHFEGDEGFVSDTLRSPIVQAEDQFFPAMESNLEGRGEQDFRANGLTKDEL